MAHYYTIELCRPSACTAEICGTYGTREEAIAALPKLGEIYGKFAILVLIEQDCGEYWPWTSHCFGDPRVEAWARDPGGNWGPRKELLHSSDSQERVIELVGMAPTLSEALDLMAHSTTSNLAKLVDRVTGAVTTYVKNGEGGWERTDM